MSKSNSNDPDIPEMKKQYELKCKKCGKMYEVMATHTQLVQDVIGNHRCTCGELTIRSFDFGMGKFNGSGFTRRTT